MSSFAGKEKQKAFNILHSKPSIADAFSRQGSAKSFPTAVEQFVCQLYGTATLDVNVARYKLFTSAEKTVTCLLQRML